MSTTVGIYSCLAAKIRRWRGPALLAITASMLALHAMTREYGPARQIQMQASTSDSNRQNQLKVLRPDELGVQRLRIPGEMNNTGDIVMLHLWLRRVVVNDQPSLIGWGFLEVLSHTWTYYAINLLQPDKVSDLGEPGALRLYNSHSGKEITALRVILDSEDHGDDRHHMGRPFWLNGDLPKNLGGRESTTYDLRVLNWNRFARFTMPTSSEDGAATGLSKAFSPVSKGWLARPEQPPPPLHSPSTDVIFVLQPFFGVDITKALSLLVGHIVWHKEAVGVAGYLVYVFSEHIDAIAADSYLTQLQQDGFLQLVLWDQEISEYMVKIRSHDNWEQRTPNLVEEGAENARYVHQAWVYNHALLVTIGRHVTLMIADLDEFIVTPTPKRAPQIVKECLADNATSVILYWRLVSCGDCTGVEIDDWTAVRKSAAGGAVPLEAHPLQRYWLSSYNYTLYGKSLVVPDRTSMYLHHEGIPHSGGRHEGKKGACDAELLHATRLFSLRNVDTMGSQLIRRTDWQWPFRN